MGPGRRYIDKSKIVTPGFDFADHDFLRREQMTDLLTPEQVRELSWMLREPH